MSKRNAGRNGKPRRPPEEQETGQPEREHLDELLDEALDDTFPASDPVAITPNNGDPPAEDR